MTSRPRVSKKKKKPDDDDMDIDDEEDERVLFFIPSAGIDIEVLVFYLKKFLGHDSDAEPGRHPKVIFRSQKMWIARENLLMTYRTVISMAISSDLDSV